MAAQSPGLVFISHSSHEHAEAERIVTALEATGVTCWIAPRDIPPGAEWAPTIVRALHESAALLLLLTSSANTSPQVLREVERAVALRLPLLTLHREAVTLTPGLEYFLGVSHQLDATTGDSIEPYLSDLVGRVTAMLSAGETPRPVSVAAGGSRTVPSVHTSTLRVSSERAGNLPLIPSPLVGREQEIGRLCDFLSGDGGTHLVTVTGTGGSGKTRLALEVARTLRDREPSPFLHGAFFVDLTSLTAPEQVPVAVANVLGVADRGDRQPIEALADALKDRRMLLLLDNCEQVVAACAGLAGMLLRSCPGVRLLATSRERLAVAGEQVFPLLPLPVPPENSEVRAADIAGFDGVRLFVGRATAVNPAFTLSDENSVFVSEICRRLDGLPLAIELAASRARSLSPRQIAERLSQRFRLLTGGSRDAPVHQQTLRALIDWSFDLLSEAEKALFCRLSVFAGGWTLEAAEKICADQESVQDWEILDLLTALADRSLVVADTPRYRLLESVREYARERLSESGGDDAITVHARHLDCFVRLATTLGEDLSGPGAPERMDYLEAERANLRLALDHALSLPTPNITAALALCHGLSVFWKVRGYLREGRDTMLRTLRAASEAGAPDSDVRAYVTIGAALCCLYLGEAEEARQLIAEGVAARRRLGEPNGIADALFNQGAVLGETGDMEGAERALEEGLTWCPPGTRTYTGLVVNLGITRFYRGDYARAEKPLTEALELNRAAGIRQGEAIAQMYLGSVALYTRHDLDAARGRYRDALRLFRELNHRRGVATALFCFAELATVAGEWDNGARLYGAHDARLAAVGSALTEASRPAYERDMAVLRAHLGEGFSAAYAAGQALGEEGAVTLALTALQGNGDVAA